MPVRVVNDFQISLKSTSGLEVDAALPPQSDTGATAVYEMTQFAASTVEKARSQEVSNFGIADNPGADGDKPACRY